MSQTVFLKPKDGLVIYDDVTMQPLPADGKKVEMSIYWKRRIKAGEVELVDLTKTVEPATNKKKLVSKETEERGN